MKKIYLLLSLALTSFSFGQTTYLNDSFNYADSTLLTANGWAAHSGAGTQAIDVGVSNGLTYAGYNDGVSSITGATSGNAARLDNNGEDDNRTFAGGTLSSGTVYFSFLLNVANATSGHFAHLSNVATGANQFARVVVRPSAITPATKFNIGTANTGTTVYGTTELDLNTTYLVVVKYDISATGAISLWVKSSGVPATEGLAGAPEVSTSGSGFTTVDRFCLRQFNASQNETVDALFVSSTWMGTSPCSLSLGTETAVCDAVTLAIDTYTITIPFTGGGSGSYTLNTNAGSISGDNPNLVASGNIIISGVSENVGVNFNITGTCTLSKIVAAPGCKIINTLPLTDVFNYTAASALGTQQMWATVNSGDDIIAVSGNLSYPGITSTGNSITFVGAGAEAKTPFTNTTSGNIYASFLLSVTDLTNVTTDLTPTYFATLTDNSGSSTVARLWIRNNAGQYQFGVSGTIAAPSTWSANLYNVGTTQYLVFGYDFTNNAIVLYENPSIPSSVSLTLGVNPAVAITSIAGFMLRQDTATSTPTMVIDELYVNSSIPGLTLSRNSFDNISGLKIYPNPAKNLLNITSDSFDAKTVVIYNVLGTQVLSEKVTNAPINVANIAKGVYVVKITEGEKTATRKLVIE